MPTSIVLMKTFAVALLLLFLVLLPVAQCLGLVKRRTRSSGLGPLLLVVILFSLLLLSACGTVPSRAPTRQPVPAALLVPPRAPTLLVPPPPASPSMTPGETTPQTHKAAPKTGSATNT